MNSDSNLKKILLNISLDIKERINRHDSMMKECVADKLNNTLEMYESELDNTCNYILIRKPLTMVNSVSSMIEEEEEEENDD